MKCNTSMSLGIISIILIIGITLLVYYKNNEDISLLYNDEEYIEDEDDLSDIIKSNKLQKYLDI